MHEAGGFGASIVGRLSLRFPPKIGTDIMADNEKTAKSSSAPLPWLMLTGLLGVFAVGNPISSTKKPEEKREAEPASHVAADDPLKPVFDFHKTHDHTLGPVDELKRNIHGYQTEFLIATVPDPIDSPYGHAFDQAVDAIQRAVEKKDGYILDRCWLPWELDRKAKPKDPPKDDNKPKSADKPTNLRENNPGVLLFRHGPDKSKNITRPGLCVVFLVGETPMTGVHKQAFHKALRIMADVGHPEAQPVRVIGPYFSGSQTSLQFVMGDWWTLSNTPYYFATHPSYKFSIIAGNATAVRKKEFFGYEDNKSNFPDWKPDGVEFASTVVPTKITLNGMLRYLTRRDGTSSTDPIGGDLTLLPGKVALLTESNTGFGKSVAGVRKDQVIVLPFPMHISRVKSESTLAFKKKDEKAGIANDDVLTVSIGDDQGPNEGVPSQGGTTTTAVNGRVLSDILTTISRERCRYVGIVATDTRDKLFLIRLIREYCPDVRIFLTGGDLLFSHPDYRFHCRGVIVGSTYPLMPRNQRWVDGEAAERLLFPSVGAQGYYNATLMHVGVNESLLEYRAPAFAMQEADTPAIAAERPPVWISMVSPSGTLVPLQLYSNYDDKSNYVALRKHSDADTTTMEMSGIDYPGAMLPVGIALACVWSGLIWYAWFNPFTRLFWRGGSKVKLPDLAYRNIILGGQVILSAPIICATWTHAECRRWESWWSNGLFSVTVLASCLLMMGMLKPLFRRGITRLIRGLPLPGESAVIRVGPPITRGEIITWVILNMMVYLLALGAVALFVGRFAFARDFTGRVLYFIRATDLASGMSPLVPLCFVCLSFGAWAFFQLKRSHIEERYHVPNPYPNEYPFTAVCVADAALRDEVNHEAVGLKHTGAVAGAIIVLSGYCVAVWMQALPTVEGWAWDTLFFMGFATLFLLSATTLIRLFYMWQSTKALLETIATLPTMRAFGKLPAKVAEVFGKYLTTQKPLLVHLQYPAHQLRLLVQAANAEVNSPTSLQNLGPTSQELDALLSKHLMHGTSKRDVIRAERHARGLLSFAAAECLRVITPYGNNLSVDEAFGGETTSKVTNETPTPDWLNLAESVAATQVVVYLSQFFVQLRNLVWAAMITASLLLLAATSYPFHPEKLLLIGLVTLTGAGIAGVLYVLIEMNREEVISRVTRTTPGKFSLDGGFIGSFMTYIVPAAGVAAAQLSGSFRMVLEPLLRVMK